MYNALRRNKPEFVQLLLENGVVMSHFLTTTKLEDLYEYVSKFFVCLYVVDDVSKLRFGFSTSFWSWVQKGCNVMNVLNIFYLKLS